ncbi:2-hydroxy-3-keto-5-methylthiopentenyl-1-phosphate phosphatase [Bacillus dakarensis]|uniref:2-hydroxy-3-keto-5-methylthiopentenyl-1- phosphate phosphatase n=1 Tax=Robertmurraya dakarensis TaxID=1926278 RepID=UPI00098094BB|nr:2-hydroxy-3-keto-5-methylthiopentenyl-1-phosphate phosphatase [Bacillus dakarensis]
MKKPVIFCDFDGTVTKKDNIVSIMKHFNPPGWEKWKDGVLSQEISIQEGVGNMFALLPSAKKEEIIQYVLETAQIRDGFGEFVQYTKQHDIPLYIVSGGIDFFVEPMLKQFGDITGLYCNQADFSGDTIRIEWPHSCDERCTNQNCGCCKPAVIRSLAHSDAHTIMIGDSVTDVEAAKMAHTVISRDYLTSKCEELSIPFQPFETFYDCINILESLKTKAGEER